VLRNTDTQPHIVSLATPGFVASGSSGFRTTGNVSPTDEHSARDALAMRNAVTLPARSVVTAVFEGTASE
jgi:hypothetical protein